MKKCNKCGELKLFTEFRTHKSTKDGLTTYCKSCLVEQVKQWHEKNKQKINDWWKGYREEKREALRQNAQRWRKQNKGKKNADTALRHAAKQKRTPPWLSKEDKQFIKSLYQLAALRTKETGIHWHVDHIVPLRGTIVSGLHVPWNLRVIPAMDNMTKGNRYNG